MHKKKYYIRGLDDFNQLVETPASKEQTEKERFIISTIISVVAAVASIIAAVASILVLLA